MKEKKNAILISAIICSFLLVACSSKELTRDAAKEILKKYSHPITVFITAGPYSDPNPTKENALLVSHGYGSMQRTGPYNYLTFVPNDKLKPYIVKTENNGGMVDLYLLISKCEPNEITGISKQSDATCIVEFTSKLDPDLSKYPLSNFLMDYVKKSKLSNCSMHTKVAFRRYDDGWRVEDGSAVRQE